MLILFVCSGNTCRSVMAEAIAREICRREKNGAGLRFASAGLAALGGEKASPFVQELLAADGMPVDDHAARPLDGRLVEEADLILVMTSQHRELLTGMYPEAGGKTFLLKEYAGDKAENLDIEDPFLGGRQKYSRSLEEIRGTVEKIVKKLLKEAPTEDENSPGQ